jgi:predicted transposase/invertase (TIGR01784 family)
VPLFNDRLEKEIDEWLHVMKYDQVPQNYSSPYMKQVAEKLTILKMSAEERDNYSYYLKKVYSDRDEMQAALDKGRFEGEAKGRLEGILEGEAKGRLEGEEKSKLKIAERLLLKKVPVGEIAQITDLTISQIEALAKKL